MTNMSKHHRWLTFFQVLLLSVSIAAVGNVSSSTLSRAQEGKDAYLVDYSLTTLDQELQHDIGAFLVRNAHHLTTQEKHFTVTVQYGDTDVEQHIRLVPTEVYESNWKSPLPESDIVSLVLRKTGETRWEIAFDPIYTSVDVPEGVNASYSFPWTGGQTWQKTQGFHYNNLGYSLDFVPYGGASNNVLAIESGTFAPYCYTSSDPYQAMVIVTHTNGDISGYLHLDKGSIPSNLFNQTIPKGQIIGSLYTGSAIYNPPAACIPTDPYKFATPCGCGTATHLHFEANHLITIQGYSLESISNAPNGTLYTSDNGSSCCGCLPASCCSKSTAQSDDFPTEFRWDDGSAPERVASMESGGPEIYEAAEVVAGAMVAEAEAQTGTAREGITWTEEPPDVEGSEAAVAAPAPAERAPLEPRTPPSSASYRIAKSAFGSGGGEKTSTHYVMNTTQGQSTDLSRRASDSYVLVPGYWGRWIPPTFGYGVYLPLVVR